MTDLFIVYSYKRTNLRFDNKWLNKSLMHILIIILSIAILRATQQNFSKGIPHSIKTHSFDKNYPLNQSNNYFDETISNFTYQSTFQLSQVGGHYFVYSPDDNWIVYTSFWLSNSIFYRNRTSMSNYTEIKIGSNQTKLNTFQFSQDNNFLFVGTYTQNIIYSCKFSSKMNPNDCKSSIDLGNVNLGIIFIQTNSANKIAVTDYRTIWILNYSSLGDLQLETKLSIFQSATKFCCSVYTITWHPLSETDLLIITGSNKSSIDKGFVSFYNITSGTFLNFSIPTIITFDVLKDKQTLLACTDDQLGQYRISLTTITKIQTFFNQGCHFESVSVSSDGTLLFAELKRYSTDSFPPLQIFKINYSSEATLRNKQHFSSLQLQTKKVLRSRQQSNVQLKLLTTMFNDSGYYNWLASSDGSQILYYLFYTQQITPTTYFERYSLCPQNNTFYSDFKCLKCSSNCTTCHLNDNFCLTCTKKYYTPINGVCFPSNFTLQNTFTLSSDRGKQFTFSPDDQWLVYTSQDPSNLLFYRKITQVNNYTQINIGTYSTRIRSFGFSKDGKYLFVGTYNSSVFYACRFSSSLSSNDCKSIDIGTKTNNIKIILSNSAGKIVITDFNMVWIFIQSEPQNFKLETKINFYSSEDDNSGVYGMRWHPLAQKDVIIFAGFNLSSPDQGFVSIYNISSRTFLFNLSTPKILSFEVLKDGQTLLACTSASLIQYRLSLQSIIQHGVIIRQGCQKTGDSFLSSDGNLFYAKLWQTFFEDNPFYQVFVFAVNSNLKFTHQITTKQNQTSSEFTCDKAQTNNSKSYLNLKLLMPIFGYDYYFQWKPSTDGNEILYYSVSNPKSLEKYALCLNNTFYSNLQCLKCSDNCSTCHFNESFCFTCANDSYFFNNNTCLLCSDFLTNCQTCTNQTYCLTCRHYFYKNQTGNCLQCDSLKTCIKCVNESECTQCDTTKGFIVTPDNGTCVCPNHYSLNGGRCISCNIEYCENCLQQNVCSLCEQSTNLSDGKCLQGSAGTILFYVIIGSIVVLILIGILVYRKFKKAKNQKKEQSLITKVQVKDSVNESEVKDEVIKNEKVVLSLFKQNKIKHEMIENRKEDPFVFKLGEDGVDKVKSCIECKKEDKVGGQEMHERLIEEQEDEEEHEQSFVGKYKRILQESQVNNGKKSILQGKGSKTKQDFQEIQERILQPKFGLIHEQKKKQILVLNNGEISSEQKQQKSIKKQVDDMIKDGKQKLKQSLVEREMEDEQLSRFTDIEKSMYMNMKARLRKL